MPTPSTPSHSRVPWIIGGALLAGAIGGAWLAQNRSNESAPPAITPVPVVTRVMPPAPRANAGPHVATPAVAIAENGRSSVERDALREGDVMALGLGISDIGRGEGPRPVKVIDISGRVFETEAVAIDGAGSGLRLEIDPDWLAPGVYMIQVETADPGPLALRRYVLEVTEGGRIGE